MSKMPENLNLEGTTQETLPPPRFALETQKPTQKISDERKETGDDIENLMSGKTIISLSQLQKTEKFQLISVETPLTIDDVRTVPVTFSYNGHTYTKSLGLNNSSFDISGIPDIQPEEMSQIMQIMPRVSYMVSEKLNAFRTEVEAKQNSEEFYLDFEDEKEEDEKPIFTLSKAADDEDYYEEKMAA